MGVVAWTVRVHHSCYTPRDHTTVGEESEKAYVVVSTGETAFYANLILKKGIIGDSGTAGGAAAGAGGGAAKKLA